MNRIWMLLVSLARQPEGKGYALLTPCGPLVVGTSIACQGELSSATALLMLQTVELEINTES